LGGGNGGAEDVVVGGDLVVYVVDLEVAGGKGCPSGKGACKTEVVRCKCTKRRLETLAGNCLERREIERGINDLEMSGRKKIPGEKGACKEKPVRGLRSPRKR
jgi:hypothetical protein